MSETLIYIILFALLMFFMHRGHGGGMGGCGGHSHHTYDDKKADTDTQQKERMTIFSEQHHGEKQ